MKRVLVLCIGLRRSLGVAALATLMSFFVANNASAQVTVFGGGGATIPVSDYSDLGAKTGWHAFAGALIAVGESGLAVGAEGVYGSNSHDTSGNSTDLVGGTALVGYSLHDPEEMGVTVFGGLGYLQATTTLGTLETDASGLTAGIGAGLDIPLGSVTAFVGGHYQMGFSDIDGIDFIGIWAGVMIPVGG